MTADKESKSIDENAAGTLDNTTKPSSLPLSSKPDEQLNEKKSLIARIPDDAGGVASAKPRDSPTEPPPEPPEPFIIVRITSPTSNQFLDGPSRGLPIVVSGTVHLQLAEYSDVMINIGNSQFVTAVPTTDRTGPKVSWSCEVNASGMKPGPITITAIARGLSFDRQKTLIESLTHVQITLVDSVPPVLTNIILPQSDPSGKKIALVGKDPSIKITGHASDYLGLGTIHIESSFSGPKDIDGAGTIDTDWSSDLPIPPISLGKHTISVICFDLSTPANNTKQSIEFEAIDNTPPDTPEGWTSLPDGSSVEPNLPTGADIDVNLVPVDIHSGMSSVEWCLDPPDIIEKTVFKPAQLGSDGKTWHIHLANIARGRHNIVIRLTDKANNSTSRKISFTVSLPYRPISVSELVSPRSYLHDLIWFTENHLNSATGDVTVEMLESVFCQPFVNLDYSPGSWGNQQVNRIRTVIEVLRRKYKSTAAAINTSAYCKQAYETMLNRIGTSYEELRIMRGASEDRRKTFASRLGFSLYSSHPDQLDLLLMKPNEVKENHLEDLFGIVNTNRDPSQEIIIPEPKLLAWQKEYLQKVWREQDYPELTGGKIRQSPRIFIDPDLIDENDIVDQKDPITGIQNNRAFNIWKARSQWVKKSLNKIKQQREAKSTALGGLQQIVNNIIKLPVNYSPCQAYHKKPLDFLECLKAQSEKGSSVDSIVKSLHLTAPAFSCLIRIKRIAENSGIVTDSEWADVYNILVQVMKEQKYTEWHDEEMKEGPTPQIKAITLTSDFFKISKSGKKLTPWRTTNQLRREWQSILQARNDQIVSIKQTLQDNIRSVEETTLHILRNTIVAAIKDSQSITIDPFDWLSDQLLIDVKVGGSQYTTRTLQAIETIQSMIFLVRTKLLKNVTAASWVFDDAGGASKHFDTEWQWEGSHLAWTAAMRVFYNPENILLPSLLEVSTVEFQKWIADLRNNCRWLSREQGIKKAKEFLEKVDVPVTKDLPVSLIEDRNLTQETLEKLRDRIDKYLEPATPEGIQVYKEVFYFVPMHLALELQKAGEYIAALEWYQTIYAYNLPPGKRKIYEGLRLEDNSLKPKLQRDSHWLVESLNPHTIAQQRPFAYTQFTIMSLAQCFVEFADAEYTRDTGESVANARQLYMIARNLLSLPELTALAKSNPDDLILPNPLYDTLIMQIGTQLSKIHQGRNIAGWRRQLQDIDDQNIIANSNSLQLLVPPSFRSLQPTPYRYNVLIERSKQLVNIAQQIETAFLSAIEKADVENFRLMEANHGLELSKEGLTLQTKRLIEAQASTDLTVKQEVRADTVRDTYEKWLGGAETGDADLNEYERGLLQNYEDINIARNWNTGFALGSSLGAALGGAASGAAIGSAFPVIGTAVGAIVGGLIGLAPAVGGALSASSASSVENSAQINAFRASHERRRQEWGLQKSIAEKDYEISLAQNTVAKSHEEIIKQEQNIALKQVANNEAIVNFLVTKFSNAQLYEYMSRVLAGVYKYFLQQTTSTAHLAQSQLVFERQDILPNFIKADYWEAPDNGRFSAVANGERAIDRRGMTGSARLLQDIYQLDQYAFETDKRKLNLVQSFSLRRLAPYEFQKFQKTGILLFGTPMKLFDSAFPGHYLRLIKCVRTSVIALIPPNQGIRATLTASGISRVVIGGLGSANGSNNPQLSSSFQTTVVRRDPELVALTSPVNATGVFELDVQSNMLMPFESMGVDTTWELRMPKAANQFDYRTIADVIITIEYTAVNSVEYYQQMVRTLDRRTGAEQLFSFRDRIADQWYALHNPEQIEDVQKQMIVRFKTERDDFPSNIENLNMERITLYFVPSKGKSFEITGRLKRVRPKVNASPNQTEYYQANSIDGIISIRGDALGLFGTSPIGEWELSLRTDDPDKNKEIQNRFKNDQIEDILFGISYSGDIPQWPM